MSLVLNMVGGGGGGLSATDALLRVQAPAGSTVTIAKGSTTKTDQGHENADDSAVYDYYFIIHQSQFDSSTPWTVTASQGSNTASTTILIVSNKEYEVELSYHVTSEYQEVEYLQAPSGAYIKTGLTQKDTYSFILDFALLNSLSSSHFLGIYDTSGINARVPGGQSYITVRYGGSDSSYGRTPTVTLNTKYRLTLQGKKYFFDGTQVYDGSSNTIPTNANIQNYLCGASNSSGGLNATSNGMRVYYCEWADDGTTVRQFYPCYRKADSVAGLFDSINKVFYTNSGTGTFTVGPDVN